MSDTLVCSAPHPQVLSGLCTATRLAQGERLQRATGESRSAGCAVLGEGPADQGNGMQEGLETKGAKTSVQNSKEAGVARAGVPGGGDEGTGRPRLALCKPSRHSHPPSHHLLPALATPPTADIFNCNFILSFENAIWGQYKIHTMITGGSSRKSFHMVHSNFN